LHGADGTHYAPCVCTVGQVSSAHSAAGLYELGTLTVWSARLMLLLNSLLDVAVIFGELSGTAEFHEDQ